MRRIDRKNCEAFFLDYYEGNLDDSQIAALHVFLGEHPHWKSVFEEYGQIADDEVVAQPHKTAFHHSDEIKQYDFDDDLIALLEGELMQEDAAQLKIQIDRSPELSAAFDLLQKTKLQPDPGIIFKDKRKLKKSAPIIPMLARYSAVAAMMGTVFVSVWTYNQSQDNLPIVAEKRQVIRQQSEDANQQQNSVASSTSESTFTSVKPVRQATPEAESFSGNQVVVVEEEKEHHAREAVTQTEEPETQNLLATIEKIPVRTATTPIKVNTETMLKEVPGSKPEMPVVSEPEQEFAESPTRQGLFGTLLGVVGEHVADKIKNISEDKLLIEQNVNQDDEVYTSTFKLGVFEVYRSRTIK